MTYEETKNKFIEEYNKYIKREGSDELLEFLKSSDFFTAPASTKYHAAYMGGLCQHSLSVFYELIRLLKVYPEIKVSGETAAICALLHDVCKIDFYTTEMRNVKENGTWVQKPYYTVDEKFKFGGHGSKSVYLISKYIKLTDEEAVAINCHMGAWDDSKGYSVSGSYEQNHFAWLLHVADESSTFIKGV